MTTERLVKAIDTVASTIITLMVPGTRTTKIKNKYGVMSLKKHSAGEMSRTLFSLPTEHGFDEGATEIQLLPSTVTDFEHALYGIQVSDSGYAMKFLVNLNVTYVRLL